MKKSCFLIGPFRAENVSLSGGDFVSGLPSPSVVLGLAGAIAMDLGVETWEHRVALVIHDLMERPGRIRGELTTAGGKRTKVLEIAEQFTGHGTFSVLVEFPFQASVNDVIASVERKRFGGGSIFPVSGKSMASIVARVSDEDFETKIKALPRGFVLAPASGLEGTRIVSTGEMMGLESIARRYFDPDEKRKGGYVVPVSCGYRVIKETWMEKSPKKSRNREIPFAFVDNAVGLGQFVSIRNKSALPDLETTLSEKGWAWACSNDGEFKMFSSFHLNAVK